MDMARTRHLIVDTASVISDTARGNEAEKTGYLME